MATLDEVISQMSEEDYFSDPIQFIIDSDLRIISVPDRGVVAGVVGDKNVNRINFQMPRYYNGFDMSKFKTRINYVNANGNPNYYTVTDSIIKDDLLIFSWLVDADVVAYAGTVAFSVNMVFSDENGVTKQAFNTSDAGRLKVLEGIQVDKYIDYEEQVDLLSKLEAEIADKATLENGVVKFWKASTEESRTDILLYSVDISSIGGTGGLDLENLTLSVSQVGNYQRLSMSDGTTTKNVDIPITTITDEQVQNAVNNYMAANPIDETDPTVPDWAKNPTKPTYTASEVGALPDTTIIPTTLPNPNALTFTGAATGSYDGSSPVEINIPEGGGTDVAVDATLSVAGQAADAKATGDAISSLSEDFENHISNHPSGDGSGGVNGKDGVGISSVEQTTISTDDGGINVVTVTKTDGTTSNFQIRNGSKGNKGDTGEKGDKGESGINGITPTIGDNGNWYLGDNDTGKPSRGEQGTQGPKGETGERGINGTDGKSAYEIAVDNGFSGTETEWLESLSNKYDDTQIKEDVNTLKQDVNQIKSNKVDKVDGKGLSTNDYDNSAKSKVDAIPENPKYTDTVYDDTQIKEDVAALKEELANNKTFKLIKSSDIVKQTKSYVSKNGELVEVPFIEDLGNFIIGNIEYSTDFSIIKLNLYAVRANRKEYDLLPFDNTEKIIDFGEIVPGFKPAKKIKLTGFALDFSYISLPHGSSVPDFGGDVQLYYNTEGHLVLRYFTWSEATEEKPYLNTSFNIWDTIYTNVI